MASRRYRPGDDNAERAWYISTRPAAHCACAAFAGTAVPARSLSVLPCERSCAACCARHHPHRGTAMKISARNQIKGKIVEVKKGATTSHVRIEIASGLIITSSITNEAVDELGLKAGGVASAIIKASDVMVAID